MTGAWIDHTFGKIRAVVYSSFTEPIQLTPFDGFSVSAQLITKNGSIPHVSL